MKVYGLDPTHFCTAPSLSWHACLKYTGVTLEIVTDPNMNLFIDGISLYSTTVYILIKKIYFKELFWVVFHKQEIHFYLQIMH